MYSSLSKEQTARRTFDAQGSLGLLGFILSFMIIFSARKKSQFEKHLNLEKYIQTTYHKGIGATGPYLPNCSTKWDPPLKKFCRLNLIFWIVMGCGIAYFARRGLKNT